MFPYSLKFIFKMMELIGFMSLYEFKTKWQNQLMQIYCSTFHTVAIIALISHLLSTTTRSIRYLPEFYQRLLEDMAFNLFYIECFIFKFNLKSFQNIMRFMAINFSMANKKIAVASHAKALFYLRLFVVVVTLALSGAILETYFPVSQEETERMRYIYKRSRPERRLETNFWLPYLDDSESWTYEILFYLEFYLIFLVIMIAIVTCTVIPILIHYLIGQYKILCKFMELLGRKHLDRDGAVIYYTDFERNQFIRYRTKSVYKVNVSAYEQHYCHQLIRFHQKLIKFQTMIQKFYSPIMFVKVIFNNMMFALCLYQLTASNVGSISKARLYKLVIEFLALIMEYYYLCDCSESLDDCHRLLTLSLSRSHWYRCSRRTQLDMCLLLGRIQRPNHLKFYQGTIVLSRAFYMSVVKLSYSFVNYMRINV